MHKYMHTPAKVKWIEWWSIPVYFYVLHCNELRLLLLCTVLHFIGLACLVFCVLHFVALSRNMVGSIFLFSSALPFQDRPHQSNAWQFWCGRKDDDGGDDKVHADDEGKDDDGENCSKYKQAISNLYWLLLFSFWFPRKEKAAAVAILSTKQLDFPCDETAARVFQQRQMDFSTAEFVFPTCWHSYFPKQTNSDLLGWKNVNWLNTEKFYQLGHSPLFNGNDVWNPGI